MKKILLLTHFNFSKSGPTHGPVHSITSYLKKGGKPYFLIAHPLYAGVKSYLERFDGQTLNNRELNESYTGNIIIKSFLETYVSVSVASKEKFLKIIAIDPLNFLSAYILKILGRTKTIVYYTVDYAEKRFPNKVTNWVYHSLDRFSIKKADSVWNVSTRIFDLRKSQDVPKSKNFYVPNSPNFSDFKSLAGKKKNRWRVFMVVGKTHGPVLKTTIAAFKKVSAKFPKARLIIAGPLEKEIRSNGNILYLGPLTHENLIKEISGSGIGLALYTKDFAWTYYGDSMKAREYLACGLPVIITNIVSTADDIRKYEAGLVTKLKVNKLSSAIEKLMSDRKFWAKSSRNALFLAKKYDIGKTLNAYLS